MTGRGVHFALSRVQEQRLLAAPDDEAVMGLIEEIEEEWARPFLVETDKAWDALHRCLSDGTLELDAGGYPLTYAILGGRQLYEGDDYVVRYVTAEQVRDIATALRDVNEAWLQGRYLALDTTDYAGPHTVDDFRYTWASYKDLRHFYDLAADEGRSVIFTVDQ
ncbi:YfbM family protein [Nonomuraea turcica]|uniref:YfbM family protein n=1 Tax=Nonomuraea sp. G32 TaxID=3067274 RepID=UPI00273AF6DA|nr:YfbM family protein [Nonomuraea sp. G32]MDP4505900.1 YfbM family protein [Nonomuraea sp. G32]